MSGLLRKKSLLGLVLAAEEAELVVLRAGTAENWFLENYHRAPLPPKVFSRQGEIADAAALAESLRPLLPPKLPAGATIQVALQGKGILVRQMRVEPAQPAERRAAIVEQLRAYAHLEEDGMEIVYQPVPEPSDAGAGSELLVAATNAATLTGLKDALAQLGLSMGVVTPRPLAAFGALLRADAALAEGDRLWMAVTLVHDQICLSLWQGARFLLYREITRVTPAQLVAYADWDVLLDPALVEQMIREIKRTCSFKGIEQTRSVTVYLVDFPVAAMMSRHINGMEPELRLEPYRPADLRNLTLAERDPSVAAIGAALLTGTGYSFCDFGFGRQPRSNWRPDSVWLTAGAAAAILAAALVVRFGFIDGWLQQVQNEAAAMQQDIDREQHKTQELQTRLPPHPAQVAIQGDLQRNRLLLAGWARLLDDDLRRQMPLHTWIDSFTLDEGKQISLAGHCTNTLTALELQQHLMRIPYMTDMQLLALGHARGEELHRFLITGALAPLDK